MMLEVIQNNPVGIIDIQELDAQINYYVSNSKADNTKKSYGSDWNEFISWCETVGFEPLPSQPETVAKYIIWMAKNEYKASTIQRRLSSISVAHQMANFATPVNSAIVKGVWDGVKKQIGVKQHHKKAILTDDLKLMLSTLSDDIRGIRDRALLLIGFAGAFRRSELISVDVEHVEFEGEKMFIHLIDPKTNKYKSKANQDGEEEKKVFSYGKTPDTCPITAYKKWLEVSGITSGAVFRAINKYGKINDTRMTDKSVANIVKRCAEDAGLDANLYSGHSLRSGLCTAATIAGADERTIMKQTGHKSLKTLRRYIQDGEMHLKNAFDYIGL